MRKKIQQLKKMIAEAEKMCANNPDDAYYTGIWAGLQNALRMLEEK